ncbi:hypothetical protein ES705_38076 [subsurface metagenome]
MIVSGRRSGVSIPRVGIGYELVGCPRSPACPSQGSFLAGSGVIDIVVVVGWPNSSQAIVGNSAAKIYPGCPVVVLLPTHILNPDGKAFIGSSEVPGCAVPLGNIILVPYPISRSRSDNQVSIPGCRCAWWSIQLIKDAGLPVKSLDHRVNKVLGSWFTTSGRCWQVSQLFPTH